MSDELTERDVEALAWDVEALTDEERVALEAVTGNHALLNGDDVCVSCHTAGAVKRILAERIAEARREGAADALEAWIAEWPTTPGDGMFLADIARAGLDRAEALRGDA